jgi:hypothetical protein
MNATAFDGGKVHLLTEQAARCGVGKHPKYKQWQMDLGEVTCQRCVKLGAVKLKDLGPAGGAEARRRSAARPRRRAEP